MQQGKPEIMSKTWTTFSPFNAHGGQREYRADGGYML